MGGGGVGGGYWGVGGWWWGVDGVGGAKRKDESQMQKAREFSSQF